MIVSSTILQGKLLSSGYKYEKEAPWLMLLVLGLFSHIADLVV